MFSSEELQEIKLFLGLLYPWDEEGEALFKSVSWTFTGKEGELTFANFAAQSLDKLIQLIQTRARRPAANVYVCLGTQRTAVFEKVTPDGFAKARRQKNNIVSFNSVALDIDVKAGGYATTEDAFAALDDFVATSGLPIPTMEVLSGSGGIHVYWCFNNAIDQAHWLQLATALQAAALDYKLKFDPAVTVNPAGILRVPNTWNHKSNPPNKVRLVREPGHTFPRYSEQQLLAALSKWTGAFHINPKHGGGANHKRTQNFTDNVGTAPPVTIDELVVNCLTLDDILFRGGDGDAEPLWNLALYAAAFTTDPHDAAHRLSEGHEEYSYDSTEKKLLEKINARTSNPDAGWPSCKQFAAQSVKCAACPLLAQGKTPFHHVIRQQAQPEPEQYVHPSTDPLLPDGYWRNKHDFVMTQVYDPKTKDSSTVVALPYPILDGGLDPLTGELCYQVSVAGAPHWRVINVSSSLQPYAAGQALSAGLTGVMMPVKNLPVARDFLVAWVKHLQSIGRVANQSSYGWLGTAFAFDDKIYHENKVETVYRGKHHDPNFTTRGELKPWQDAMRLVYGNMPLETVVASAFAAPLVELVGTSSLVLSCYSKHSGIGKTTAMMLAQSVWGHPRMGMSTLADTTNSMMKKIGDLRSLPVYWDELRTRDQLEKVIDIVFQVTQGKGKARLNKDITQAEAPMFTTMFVVASNHGIVDTVYSQTESTEAGGLRLFEIEPVPVPSRLTSSQADQLLIPLQTNFGMAGALYAEWLAQNRDSVIKILKLTADALDKKHNFQTKERFWRMTMTTLLAGAGLANHCGLANFDVPALDQFLGEMLARQRGEMKQQEYATMAATRDVIGLIQEMISEQRGKGLIVTERIPYPQMGRPTPNNLVDTDLSRLGDIWLQLGDLDGRLRARLRPFKEWLRKRQLNPRTIIDSLRGHYVVTQSKQTIGGGVPGLDASTRLGQTECIDLTPLPSASSHAPSHDSDAPTPPPS